MPERAPEGRFYMHAEGGFACFAAPALTEYNLPVELGGKQWRRAHYVFTTRDQDNARGWARGDWAHGVRHDVPEPPGILIPVSDWQASPAGSDEDD